MVRSSAGGIILNEVAYRYDGLNRLVERSGNGSVLRTSYDGEHAWSDADASGTIQARYLFGDRIDSVLARWQPANGSAWYLTDHLGTVRQIINGAGADVLNAVGYSAFGEIVSQSNPAAGDRFAFTGREWEAAAGLYYYRARFYDAASGRFVSQDPIGFNGGDANLYRYVANSTLAFTDPSGLNVVTEDATIKSEKNVVESRFICKVGRTVLLLFKYGNLVYKIIRVATLTSGYNTAGHSLISPPVISNDASYLSQQKEKLRTQNDAEAAKVCGP